MPKIKLKISRLSSRKFTLKTSICSQCTKTYINLTRGISFFDYICDEIHINFLD